MKSTLLILSVSILLLSCKTQNLLSVSSGNKQVIDTCFQFNADYEYKIRANDKISIGVWGQEDLSVGSVYGIYNSNAVYGKWLLVDAQGNIELPKVGQLNVVGLTIREMKDTLKVKIGKWLINPIVDVKILNKEITLLGEVRSPGVITVDKDQTSLLEMLAKAGGTEFYANIKKIKILRQEGQHVRISTINLTNNTENTSTNIALRPGDIVLVPSRSYKEFDKRISVIIPFTTAISAAAILLNLF